MIWSTAPVTEQPELTLIRWKIIEIDDGRHFVGYCLENREGRVSTAIVEFDPETLKGVTRSGRIYQLRGPSGYDSDGMYVWEVWKRGYMATSEDKDVSAEVTELHTLLTQVTDENLHPEVLAGKPQGKELL